CHTTHAPIACDLRPALQPAAKLHKHLRLLWLLVSRRRPFATPPGVQQPITSTLHYSYSDCCAASRLHLHLPPFPPPPPQLALPRKTDPRSRTSIASTSPFLPYHVDVMDTSDGAGDSRPSNYSTGLYSSPSASFDSLRDQILANARVLYGREHKLIEVITSKELDGSELVLQQNFAYLVAFGVGSSSSIPGVGGLSSSSNAMSSSCGVTILSCSEPAETRDEAMRSLLDEVEAEVGELVTKELKDQKIPIERKRRRRERLVEQSRLARSA
ncbi:hypothetical protein IWX91DRAFT_14507, partial [Phyllosticta citricarpa]